MDKFIRRFCILLLNLAISSCSTELSDYERVEKPFDIKKYFNGEVTAWGMIQSYTNKVERRFCVEIIGSWQGNKGTLAETFYFDDGEISYRNWQLIQQPEGHYLGTAEDVSGMAIGKHQGFAFQFQYQLELSLEGKTYEMTMDDWMYQLDQYRVINKTSMSKFGIKVAEITLFFDKELPATSCSV
ncbi:DUF3833 domain-containing protein [Thalassotalea profundi]|uniref:DUF3833 domain-containing protein n=1 Tax=Thalassotalea profundi TaxID=2036687 RepID=A0ABQ3IHH4_9GAMM|nr:DUF3833 domain-containing protein [Thalassotalea profundi]GHE81419.1 hypothetical protein GCM10011501_06980 [Thalassotalea profundi]